MMHRRGQAEGQYGAATGASGRQLARYATNPAASAGRVHEEPSCPNRTAFQRDRDRIVHATAFRRLTYKTQVFVFHEGDHFRSRLTHSLEVAQIARALARMLLLDEDLAEALALAHDLGHPPFGHAGERALAAAMRPCGGFDHNAQSLRVVTRLERSYVDFDGLNLSLETLEGIAKHNGPLADKPGAAVLRQAVAEAGLGNGLNLAAYAPAEAQAAALADDIAYNSHDLDDGLRAGLLRLEELSRVPLAGPLVGELLARVSDRRRVIHEVNRRMITTMIEDACRQSRIRLAALPEQSLDGVRGAADAVVALSADRRAEMHALQAYLFANLYRHPRVMRIMDAAEGIVGDLFQRYMRDPGEMPASWRAELEFRGSAQAAVVGDFVAGMTDRYALKEHRRLFATTPELG
jgi:dGTPase